MELEQASRKDLRDTILKYFEYFHYLKKKWFYLLLCFVIGGIIGGAYYNFSEREYTGKITFIIDEELNSENPGLTLLGFGMEEDKSLFSGDNLLWLYQSSYMLERVLLTSVKYKGEDKLLLNWLISIDKNLQKVVESQKDKNNKNYKDLKEPAPVDSISIAQKLVLNTAVSIVRGQYLKVYNEDKTKGVVAVEFVSTDEVLSKKFVEQLVQLVNDFYVTTKSQKAVNQLNILQKRVDEFESEMEASFIGTAESIENIPYPNPNLATLNINPQREGISAEVNTSLYTQAVTQLEAAKLALQNEIPLIQIVDRPIPPLPSKKPKLIPTIAICSFGFLFLALLFFILKYFYHSIMRVQSQDLEV